MRWFRLYADGRGGYGRNAGRGASECRGGVRYIIPEELAFADEAEAGKSASNVKLLGALPI
jgi:hypothetical protein